MNIQTSLLKPFIVISYFLMIWVNAMANILPINNVTTGGVSDSFPNLFAPAGVTFSIWGLIYLLLGAYSVYQFTSKKINNKVSVPVNTLFIVSSLVNSTWIFAWHYRIMWLTVLLMLVLLGSLIKIADVLREAKLKGRDTLLYKIPFGVYFGWITVATIANITAFLVSIGWNGFGLPDTTWMILILFIGCGISAWRMHKDSNIAYGLVPVWAYSGIWHKHTSPGGFAGSYPEVVTAVLVCIVLLVLSNVLLLVRHKAM